MNAEEPVGTVTEEAAKLLAAISDWAGGRGRDAAFTGGPAEPADHESSGCRWCPLCSAARVAKSTRPEVRSHLSQAALSLALAAKAILEDVQPEPSATTPVEKIDLAEE